MEGQDTTVTTMPQGQGNGAQGAAIAQGQADLMIPKWRFDEATKLHREAEVKISELTKQLEETKTKDTRIAELEKELQDLKDAQAAEKVQAKKDAAIELAIKDKAIDMDVVKKLLDMEKIAIDDKDVVTGLEEQVKELQTSKPFLWKKAQAVAAKSSTMSTKPERSFAQKLADKKVKQLGVAAKSKNYFN